MHYCAQIETIRKYEESTELLREELPGSAGGNSTKILVVDDTDNMLLLVSQ